MKNEKAKSKDSELYTITIELQAGRRATFTYNDLELATNHYDQIQAISVIGHLGVKSLQRSWKK